MKVMISSTLLDLPEHRDAVRDSCSRLDVVPVMMDFQAADAGSFARRSIALVDSADIFIIVLGHRYGTTEPSINKSYTHIELDRAHERGIPILAFLMDDDHPIVAKNVDAGEGRLRIDELRKHVAERYGANFFRNVDHLRAEVINALSNLLYRAHFVSSQTVLPLATAKPAPFVAHPYTLLGPQQVIGRESDTASIDQWLNDDQAGPILVLQGLGGAGKSACLWDWFSKLSLEGDIRGSVWWSFYDDPTFPTFLRALLSYLSSRDADSVGRMPLGDQVDQAVAHLSRGKHVVVLDGLERSLRLYASDEEAFLADEEIDAETANLLSLGGGNGHDIVARERSKLRLVADPQFAGFLHRITRIPGLKVVISTRLFPADLQTSTGQPLQGVSTVQLSRLDDASAIKIWESVTGDQRHAPSLVRFFRTVDNHPLFIRTLAIEVNNFRPAPGDFLQWREAHSGFDPSGMELVQAKTHILTYALRGLTQSDSQVLAVIAGQPGSVPYGQLERSLLSAGTAVGTASELDLALSSLEDRALVGWDRTSNRYDMHPVVRAVARRMLGVGVTNPESRGDRQWHRIADSGVKLAKSPYGRIRTGNSLTSHEATEACFEVQVVAGPDAGRVVTLPLGVSQIGCDPSAWLQLEDSALPRIALVVERAADDRIDVTAAHESDAASINGPIKGRFQWEEETIIDLGNSSLRLVRAARRQPVAEQFPSGIVRRCPRLGAREQSHPHDPANAVLTAQFGGEQLWERAPDDPDYLVVSLGYVREADRSVRTLATVSLGSDRLFAVVGGEEAANLVNWILVQIGTYHSPMDVEIALLTATEDCTVRWAEEFPHSRSGRSAAVRNPTFGPSGSRRRVADLLAYFSAPGAKRKKRHHVVVLDGWESLSRIPGIYELVDLTRTEERISVLIIGAQLAGLPMATKAAAIVRGRSGDLRTRTMNQEFTPTGISSALAKIVAGSLTDLRDFEAPTAPNDILSRAPSTLEGLLGEDPSPESIKAAWKESRRGVALVGTSLDGPFSLDLSQLGPLILLGGTTGSGKSELLMTFVASLALTTPPSELGFLLIDYKGGAAFGTLYRLPHVVGLVTDLSPELARRALISLSAELRRRERILLEHSAKDFTTLQQGANHNTLERLVVIVDEFASLAVGVPDFIDGIVDVALRGRSLGITMVLSTQRPAGVIREVLARNARTRIALRMVDEADSEDLVGLPDAANISRETPGRGIVRLPSGEIHEVQFASISTRPGALGRRSWADELVASIETVAAQESIGKPHRPWLPELGPSYDLEKLLSRTDTRLVFGVSDVPERQSQLTAAFEPDRDGNLAVHGTGGSGKTTLLRSLAIAAGVTPLGGPCHVYGLDFGTRGLAILEVLPHVQSIAYGGEREKVSDILSKLRAMIDKRAVEYSRAKAATITEYRHLSEQVDEARIILLVDGLSALREARDRESSNWLESLGRIAADGRPVGVHVILSSETDNLGSALSSVVQCRVALRPAAPDEYLGQGIPRGLLGTNSPPGRGVVDRNLIQVAIWGGAPDLTSQFKAVEELANAMRSLGHFGSEHG